MKPFLLVLILSFQGILCFANMGNPVMEGTKSGSVILSEEIDILSETIDMKIDSNFTTCQYKIEYNIQTDSVNVILPLAFIAIDYSSDFKIYLDNKPIALINCDTCNELNLPFEKLVKDGKDYFYVYWNEHIGQGIQVDELKYFKIPLSKNQHKITVEYTANAWTDLSGWTNEYSFRYSLSPAETWKSFNNLTLSVTSEKEISSNLGAFKQKEGQTYTWTFDSLPAKYFSIIYKPQPSRLASILIGITPEGLALIFSAFLIFCHSLWLIKSNKKRTKTLSTLKIGLISLVSIIAVYIFYLYSYPMIDSLIGLEAGNFHGYYFLNIIFTPVLLAIHWLIVHVINVKWKNENVQ